MNELDSLQNIQIQSVIQILNKISENTNAWNDFISGFITIVSLLASATTIIGIITLIIEFQKKKTSRKRQELIIKDLIRHVFINAAIMEIIRIKMSGNWKIFHPVEGTFSKFCVLETDLQLDQIKVKDSKYTKLHSLSLYLRNYNILSNLAERHYNDPEYETTEKILELNELWKRTKKISDELLELGNDTNLKINKETVKDYIFQHYENKRIKREKENKPLPKIQIPNRIGDSAFFDNELNLNETFNFCIRDRYEDVRVVPFAIKQNGNKKRNSLKKNVITEGK